MKWTNKNVPRISDLNDSKLSSRSKSKFKKVNLQKNNNQISEPQIDKSFLKLSSLQKIKYTSINSSRISYLKNQSQSVLIQSAMPNKQDSHSSNFSSVIYQPNKKQTSSRNILTKQIYPLFSSKQSVSSQRQTQYYQNKNQINKDNIDYHTDLQPQFIKATKLSPAQAVYQMNNALKTLNLIASQMKELCEKVVQQLNNQTFAVEFGKLQAELFIFVKQFSLKFQTQLKQASQIKPSLFSYKINSHPKPCQFTERGPNAFKNYFKSILKNNQQQRNSTKIINQIKFNQNGLYDKINTEPLNQDNSFFSNNNCAQSSESYSYTLDNQNRMSRVKFKRSIEKNLKKSVKRIQQKIGSLKKNLLNQVT